MLFPSADVGLIVAKRPSLLLSPEWESLEKGKRELVELFPEGTNVDAVVEQQPLLLVADLPTVTAEISRLIPERDPGELIAENPGVFLTVMDNSVLSIW